MKACVLLPSVCVSRYCSVQKGKSPFALVIRFTGILVILLDSTGDHIGFFLVATHSDGSGNVLGFEPGRLFR